MKTALYDGAKTELGYEDRRQPDWFQESEKDLGSLFSERNHLYALWTSTGNEMHKKIYKAACKAARREMRAAKDSWFQRKPWKLRGGGMVGS